MSDRTSTIGPAAALVALLGVCCGLPVLASVGALSAIAGFGIGSWVIVGVSSAITFVGIVRWRTARRACAPVEPEALDVRAELKGQQ